MHRQDKPLTEKTRLSRRDLLKLSSLGAAGVAGTALLISAHQGAIAQTPATAHAHHQMPLPIVQGPGQELSPEQLEVLRNPKGLDPMRILTDFDVGKIFNEKGRRVHEYEFVAHEQPIEVAPGVLYPAWTYNGRVPGPTIRVTEGARVRIIFKNGNTHPHSMHFHGIHPAGMDGVFESVPIGGQFVYEFDAEPFGVHLYHCHILPLAKHIAKGLYGVFIVDPKEGRPKADKEFVMVMNGFDIDFDDENDFYSVNSCAFYYQNNPIKIKVGELVRIYLINLLEFDPINSFHLHANFFHYYPTGTSLTPSEYTDTIAQMQGQRGILEFRYKYPGKYMFHAHKTEFAELGWSGIFEVEESP
jgi:FtsP/CotA-like multicopper oxidase with cupredoxin domain